MALRAIPIKVSTRIRAVQYDDDAQELMIEYRNGAIYSYYGVTGEDADGFSAASSPGRYLNEMVGKWTYARKS